MQYTQRIATLQGRPLDDGDDMPPVGSAATPTDHTPAQSDPFFEIRRVEVEYPNGTVALKPTDLDIAASEVTVLLGPSGAGKSTLLRVLNHLVPPTGGTVTVRGIGVLNTRDAVRTHRRRTGMVFQQHQLIGRLTVLQNVLLSRIGNYPAWRTLLPMPDHERRWAADCLTRVGLFDKALTRCVDLSGGQQQRVGIARALAQRPDVILADEPVASLDPAASERVLSLLRDVCRQDGIPAVVSLHQIEYAREFADRIVGLSRGSVVFDGPPSDLSPATLHDIYGS